MNFITTSENTVFVDFDTNFTVDFNIIVNSKTMRVSHYSVRHPDNTKQKSVDKFTHFIINIGNFVNKQLKFNKFFKKICCPILTSLVGGSPIIQDNKIIGALTHVFINNPKKGYGISVNNMK